MASSNTPLRVTPGLPALDTATLDELEEELADHTLMRQFAADFAVLWEQRLARLDAAVEDQDQDAALDAAISVKVSSAMIGAIQLARLAESLERAIRNDVLHERQLMRAAITEAGAATLKEIGLRYSLVSG